MRTPIVLFSLSLGMFCAVSSAPIAPQATAQTVAPPVADAAPPAASETVSVSQVRIVRLSQVRGEVELDRRTGQAFDLAFANLPIVAGEVLRTKQGLAEVEFEDNSSLRLTPQSQVEFPSLGRDVSGAAITAINLVRGSLYISLADSKAAGNFTVTAGNRTIVLAPSTHLRLDLDKPAARMVVFQGSATVTGPSNSMVVTRKKAIAFDPASVADPQIIRTASVGAFDAWDKNAADYHKLPAAGFNGSSGLASTPYSYGVNDLASYGSFSNVAGCGAMWRPYLASASFDPYASGVWSWYPGQGYSWVSLYPWGWTPFHSGSWNYCPAGGGWGWSPQGGTWRSVKNYTGVPVKGTRHYPGRPAPPPPPRRGEATLIAVNVRSLEPSRESDDGKFVLRAGSAGLGVPRGVFNNTSLAKLSQTAETRGSASTYLSEHQQLVGLMASSRTATSSASSAGQSSVAYSGGTASIYSASRSSQSNSSPSSSFSSSSISYGTPSSGLSNSSATSSGSGSHH